MATSDNNEVVFNMENITIIWYNSTTDLLIDRKLLKEELNACMVLYTQYQTCINYIKSIPKNSILFITSVLSAREILPTIHTLRQIDSIFLISDEMEIIDDLLNDYSKITGFFRDIKSLTEALQENIELVQNQTLTFSFYSKYQKSTRELSQESASFLWFQLFKDVILHMSSDDLLAKQDMVAFLRRRYHNNNKQLQLIDNFEKTYNKVDAIRWYTGQPFIYKNLNKALRTEDIEQLYIFRFFISDLCKNLVQEFQILKEYAPIVTLFRGTRMSIAECEKLKQNEGQLISTNGFLSTSLSKEVARTFAGSSNDTKQSVLFEIYCDLGEVETIVLAQVVRLSTIPSEEEVLIDIGAVFEILSIDLENTETNLLLVKMKVTDEGAKIAKEYIEINQQELKQKSVSIMWGDLLMSMGHYDKALLYFAKLQDNDGSIEDWELQKHIGQVLREKGKLDEALMYYTHANELINKQDSQDADWICISILHDIGIVFRLKGFYDQALSYFNQVLELIEKEPSTNGDIIHSHDLGACLSNIGSCYYNKGEYDQAMTYYMRASHIKGSHYSVGHIDRARDLNHIGIICKLKGEYVRSMEYFSQALQIFQKSLPSDHHDIASTLINIGDVLDNQGKKQEALQYLMQALKIQLKAFPNGHLDMALCLNNIAAIYGDMKEIEKAIEHSTLSLELKRKFLRPDHDDIAIGLTNHGNLFQQMGKNDDAYEYYMEALTIYHKNFPDGHPNSAALLVNIGMMYQAKDDYDSALSFYEKARTIQVRHFPCGHPNLALALSSIAHIYQLKGDISISTKYYMECASMQEKYYTADDKNMTNTWMELANILMFQDKMKEAMHYYKKVFLINENEIEDVAAAIGYNLQLIASIYESLGQLETAREYCEKALRILQKYSSNDLNAIVLCLLNISEIYEKETKYDDALTYALQALQMQTTINPNGSPKIIENQNNIGFLYMQKKDYETALVYYLRSVELYDKLLPDKNHIALAATFDNVATTYGELHKNTFAIQYYRKALDIYKHIIHTNSNNTEEINNVRKAIDEINKQIVNLSLTEAIRTFFFIWST